MTFVSELSSAGISTEAIGGEKSTGIIAGSVHLPLNATVLEVGGGGGLFAIGLAQALERSVVSIDIDPGMLKLAQKNYARISSRAQVDFRNIDVMSSQVGGPFDMVAHRGIEIFFQDRSVITRRMADLVKPLGYLVAITQTYEVAPTSESLSKINDATGYFISPTSRAQYIAGYEDVGLHLISSTELSVEPARVVGEISDDLARKIAICNENDALTRAFLLIFRKGGPGILLSEAVHEAKA